jgi:hypothetical protein
MPGQASASLPTRGPVPQERAERIVIRLTRGGLKNNYVSLAKHLDFFPAAAIGAARVQDREGVLLTLHFAGFPDTVRPISLASTSSSAAVILGGNSLLTIV